MQKLREIIFAVAVGFVLALFAVRFYNHWYFGEDVLLKSLLLTPLLAGGFLIWRLSANRRMAGWIGWFWLATFAVSMLESWGAGLGALSFTQVLDYEALVVWVPLAAIAVSNLLPMLRSEREKRREKRAQLQRHRMRKRVQGSTVSIALLALASLLAVQPALAQEGEGGNDYEHGSPELRVDRHDEFKQGGRVTEPAWPAGMPDPMHLRPFSYFYIIIENKTDGSIRIADAEGRSLAERSPGEYVFEDAGKVLAPVSNVNNRGFTASGWAEPGQVTASAVNAVHIKTDHDSISGRAVIFSLLPIEFADFDPKEYRSYFNQSSSLFTDIDAGTSIFGGAHAPTVNSRLLVASGDALWHEAKPAGQGYVPAADELLVVEVARRRYNPEWIEFENAFGGLIWVKEWREDPYPIGQVLKPVVGVGRFLGTQYADSGHIRAAHPGVICISTTPDDSIGGFQIIPRDHAMSPEMVYTRYKTQWMVVGPLWALDPSWEGLPPLFSEYMFPAYTPLSADADWRDVYLNRFIVKGRYRDADDPEAWAVLQETSNYDNYALKNLTHIRIYFPVQ